MELFIIYLSGLLLVYSLCLIEEMIYHRDNSDRVKYSRWVVSLLSWFGVVVMFTVIILDLIIYFVIFIYNLVNRFKK